MKTERITLYYRQGSSDKVYQASLEESQGGFVVNFAYGRRGTALKSGTKTASPLPYEEAKAAYDKLVRSKTAKGYTPGKDGTPYKRTDKEDQITGVHCQLLNAIDEAQTARLIDDPEYWMQEKHDGRRFLLKKQGNEITGINRKGLAVGISKTIEKSARDMGGSFLIDGECVGEVLHVFDILTRGGEDLRSLGYAQRLRRLHEILSTAKNAAIVPVETATSAAGKRILFERLKREGREGVVFKHCAAPYTAGRPNSGGSQLKYKFYATASLIVASHNGKRSVALELFTGKQGKKRVPAGNVTIPANHAVPKEGAIVEVRYLYAYRESGSLYQPVYLGERDDIKPSGCTLAQLKYRTPHEDDEA